MPKLDVAATSKAIRSILNKVSEGNIDPMFKQLLVVVESTYQKSPIEFCKAYSDIFIQLSVNLSTQMTAILSVNCVYVAALHRLYGDLIFTNISRELFVIFKQNGALTWPTAVARHSLHRNHTIPMLPFLL